MTKISPANVLAHELGHAWRSFFKGKEYIDGSYQKSERYDDMEEETVIKTNEQPQTALDGQGKRFNHGGTFYKTSSPTSVSPAPVTDEGQLGQGNSIKVNSTK